MLFRSRTLVSQLDSINGVSEKLKFALLKEFGSIEIIKNASPEELMQIKGIGEVTANNILQTLNNKPEISN